MAQNSIQPVHNALSGLTRRHFVKTVLAGSVALGAVPAAFTAERPGQIPLRTLGRTGQKISALGLGGFHIGMQPDENESIGIIRAAIDHGITFMDNCWDYHEGGSEIRMGKALRDGYRDKVFLMSKIDGHTQEAATRQIDESLKRLQTDHVDLMQFHEVIRMNDPEKIFGPRGSFQAMVEARKAGKVRFIGFTGHKDPSIHLHMLEVAAAHDFHFDAVQMPLNLMDAHFRSFEKQVLPVLQRQGIGVLGMKPLGGGHLLKSHAVKAQDCLHYALSLPVSTVITGIDSREVLQQAVSVGSNFKPLTRKALTALLARTAPHARKGEFEPFKMTTQFDGTVHNPQWLG
ncbi:MAG TPA: aldo/keto reductase [Clostridia bacterium]|nr:aldo/keto reductase [Clostridia bacterium]